MEKETPFFKKIIELIESKKKDDRCINDRKKISTGFPNKNTIKIFNKHLCEYPIIAAKKLRLYRIFLSQQIVKN